MAERLKAAKDNIIQYLRNTTLKQRIIGSTLLIALIGIILLLVYNVTKVDYVQLYSGLSERETGEVSAKLTEKGIKYRLTVDGRGVLVPKEVAAQVKVDLAAEGIPKSGVMYNDFSQNMGLGLTDREFSVVERDAMQNELKRLMINGIRGISDAQVMITLPKESIWVNQVQEQATATVILQIDPGYTLNQNQVNALYTIVSKSIPNLSVENIIITNQYGEELSPNYENSSNIFASDDFTKLNNIKKEIEKDIEKGIKQILGAVMKPENVVVKAFASMDYTQERREENLVTSPTNNSNGLAISMENLNESWNGQGGTGPGGIAGPGQTDIVNYQATNQNTGDSNYEKTSERVNYEVNRITRSIVESPYKVGDLSVSVSVNMPTPNANDLVAVQQYNTLKSDIKTVVMNVVRTTLATQGAALSEDEIEKRISVMATPFSQQSMIATKGISLWWVIAIAGIALVAIIAFIIASRKRNKVKPEEDIVATKYEYEDIPQFDDNDVNVRKQLERLAKEKPTEFVSLLRTWIVED